MGSSAKASNEADTTAASEAQPRLLSRSGPRERGHLMGGRPLPFKRGRLLVFAAVFAAASAAFVFACGSDSSNGPGACPGPSCDEGGGAEATTPDGSGDTPLTDAGGRDADSAMPVSCGEGGAGTLDPTFGDGGLVWLYNYGTAGSVAVQADGKILVGGTLGQDLALVRLQTDGTLDATFGDAGVVETKIGAATSGFQALALQTDGKVVAVARATFTDGTQDNFAVARYLTSGLLDPSFGDAGAVITDFSNRVDGANSVALLADGRILAGGQSAPNVATPNTDFALALYHADGSLDTSFGDAGKIVSTFVGAAYTVVVDDAGRVILGGTTGANFAVLQLAVSGDSDPTFGDGGLATSSFSGSDTVATLLLQQDGRVIAAGGSIETSTFRLAAARYLATGAMDPGFGVGGQTLVVPPPNADIGANAAAIESCAFVAVGTFGYDENSLPQNAMGIARFRR